MDEHDLPDELGAQGAPPTADALRSIVARHRRTRTRTLGVALAVALVAGPVGGWALARSGGGGGQKVATSNQPAGAPAQAPALAGAAGSRSFGPIGLPGGQPAKHLFSRTTADGVAIRAYRVDPPPADTSSSTTAVPTPKPELSIACPSPGKPADTRTAPESGTVVSNGGGSTSSGSASGGVIVEPAQPGKAPNAGPPPAPPCMPPECKPTPVLLPELSTDAAVGQGFAPLSTNTSSPLSNLSAGWFGVAEGSPVLWAAAQTGSGAATVRLRLPSGATDQMAPSGGVAVLAHGVPSASASGAVVEALDSSGKVIASESLDSPQPQPQPMMCGVVRGATATAKPSAPAPTTTTR
jgi:hypothetical protein